MFENKRERKRGKTDNIVWKFSSRSEGIDLETPFCQTTVRTVLSSRSLETALKNEGTWKKRMISN